VTLNGREDFGPFTDGKQERDAFLIHTVHCTGKRYEQQETVQPAPCR
jgi:hypothetical protein